MTADAETVAAQAPSARGERPALALAVATATLGWLALAIEGERSIADSLADGRGPGEAIFLFLHFFTILTNIGIAVLMSVTAARLLSRRALPVAPLYNAGLVYILVTCVTYEVMLRAQWSPHGMRFVTDVVIHDVVPALMLVFWLAFAPRHGARWRDPLWILAYPAAYLAMTLVAGAFGEGYPYSFLNVDRLGYARVLQIAMMFLAIFFALGSVATGLTMMWGRAGPPPAKPPGVGP